MLHRAKRTPGQFMMRLRTPNGIVTSDQMRFYSDSVSKYGDEIGVIDITTRANIVSIHMFDNFEHDAIELYFEV